MPYTGSCPTREAPAPPTYTMIRENSLFCKLIRINCAGDKNFNLLDYSQSAASLLRITGRPREAPAPPTYTMIRENSLFCKLIRIKSSSKALFGSFMAGFRP